jgi:predicted hotdog family 3-hydroxylacyl-ACP dehydratase
MSPAFPRPVADFTATIPHRPPFVWIDEVVSVSEGGGIAAVTLRADALFMSRDGIRRSSLLEFMAQGFAYVRAAQAAAGFLPDRPAPKKAFLVSIQDAHYETNLPGPMAGERLTIEILGAREVGPITIFTAKVSAPAGLLVQARLKVFSE